MDEGQGNQANGVRVTLEVDHDVCNALENLRIEMGLKSRGSLINRLLREVLLGEEQKSQSGHL